jgi:hypothetical protein
VVGNWEGCGLNATVVAGGWILLVSSSRSPGPCCALLGDSGVMLARRFYAVGLPLVGLAHFLGAAGATVYVPTWLPLRVGWA